MALGELHRRHLAMIHDLSADHHAISSLFPDVNHRTPRSTGCTEAGRLLPRIWLLERSPILSDEQVEALRQELARLLDASPEERGLFYEYNSNESNRSQSCAVPCTRRLAQSRQAFTIAWHRAFTVPAAHC